MTKENTATEQLPSLPQVLVRVLDAIHREQADFQGLGDIIRQDVSMTARLVAVANSSYYSRGNQCQSVERALLLMGTDTVKTIVITASIRQFFNHFSQRHRLFLKRFWRRSLIGANFAYVLATLTRYPQPDEAYLCGLLMDVGQLSLLTSQERLYWPLLERCADDASLVAVERETFGHSHCELGAELVSSWQLSPFMADALRFHHEPAQQVQDAHHLVKLVNLANTLSVQPGVSDAAAAAADTLFGLNEALTRELRARIDSDVERLASTLGIDIDAGSEAEADLQAQQALGQRLGDISQLTQVNSELWRAQNLELMQQAVRRTAYITLGVDSSLLFLADLEQGVLEGWVAQEDSPDFRVALEPGRSLIADALLQRQPTLASAGQPGLSVVDRQLLGLGGRDHLWSLPLVADDLATGVLILGVDAAQLALLREREDFVLALAREIATAVANQRERLGRLGDNPAAGLELEQRIREAVHEAGNPLSIINNYLELLRHRLGEDHEAHRDLGLIREEIDRVGGILLRLRDPQPATSEQSFDLNELISRVARIFSQSVCSTHNITLSLALEPGNINVELPAGHIKQILTNLLKNAVEALHSGGEIRVESRGRASVNGRDYTVVTISDNGPGLPAEVMQKLFSPVVSQKGGGHSGLGLSIVKRLVDEMNATIVCTSGKTGTQFQLLLPMAHPG